MDRSLFAVLDDNAGYNKTNKNNILNPYINFHKHENTQTLADVIVAESIQMRGIESYFIPREYVNPDMLFGEDLQNKFTKAWKFAAYLESFEGYGGMNSYFSKFGMTVNDEINLTINPKLFKHQTNDTEPKEGDLLYFPMDNSLFEIIWVEPYDPFYQVGKNAMRKINAQKFVYSGEELNPELQINPDINDDYSDLELDPIRELNGLTDINNNQYKEVEQINKEADEYIDPHIVVNGRGAGSPFDSLMED